MHFVEVHGEKKPGVLMAGDVEVKFDREIETTKNLAG